MQLTDLTTVSLLVVLLLTLVLVYLVRRRRRATPAAQLKRGCREMLTQVVVPDGEGGLIHLEFALLCPRGIVIVNIKDVEGNVFGSDTMNEWAVLTGKRRFGMPNPQDGLYDRIAAVKRLLPDIPVQGYIVFTERASFTKGVPSHVMMLNELVAELQQEYADTNAAFDAYLPGWEKLKAASAADS